MISWEEKSERAVSFQQSEFLESMYLGKELRDIVVMERSIAAMLKYRLTELEKENEHLRKSIRILKIALSGVISAAVLAFLVLSLLNKQI